jgi:hypothetical protein
MSKEYTDIPTGEKLGETPILRRVYTGGIPFWLLDCHTKAERLFTDAYGEQDPEVKAIFLRKAWQLMHVCYGFFSVGRQKGPRVTVGADVAPSSNKGKFARIRQAAKRARRARRENRSS